MLVADGVDALVREFTYKAARIQNDAGDAVVRHAGKAADRMRSTVRVYTSTTLESIDADDTPTRAGGAVYADAGADWFVARFLEHGTVKMAPRPFIGPAADATIPGLVAEIKRLGGL